MTEQEIKEEKRRRQLAVLKASNELLRQAKETALKHTDDPLKRTDLEAKFDEAIMQNKLQGSNILHASESEIESAQFREPSKHYVDEYNKRLAAKGISDEEMRRKDEATVTTRKGKDGKMHTITRRPRRGGKKDTSEIVRVENEEEIMMQTMVKDDKDIEENIKKNDAFINERLNKKNDPVEKVKENIKEEKDKTMIGTTNVAESGEHIKVANTTVNEVKQPLTVENATVTEKPKKAKKVSTVKYDFDFSSIPEWVQFDVLPLPSNGQCYPKESPLRCGKVPVAYLTAADENIILSPNVYRDGKLLDIILERKVLDKRINIHDLCSGDRDAIILWLRATSYGEDFPISATNPSTGKQYNVVIKLSEFDYNDFDLEGDDDGLFDYETSNGDKIKFRFFTNDDEEELKNTITSQIADMNKIGIIKSINNISAYLRAISLSDEENTMINEDIEEIRDIIGSETDGLDDTVYSNTVTEQMIKYTFSVNGNTDIDFIRNYIENMRIKDSMLYRNYINNNIPGVNFNFNVNIPESDGGGSFATFLRISDSIFINF